MPDPTDDLGSRSHQDVLIADYGDIEDLPDGAEIEVRKSFLSGPSFSAPSLPSPPSSAQSHRNPSSFRRESHSAIPFRPLLQVLSE